MPISEPGLSDFISRTEEETRRWGARFAGLLVSGDIVGLEGPFGAGKTRVVKAVSAALGIERDRVTSPSFTLINRYPGTPPVVHMDTYRLEGAGDFEMLDPEYYWTNADAVVFIEWAEKVRASLPKRIYWLKIDILDASTRRFRLEFPPGVNSRAAGRTGEGGP